MQYDTFTILHIVYESIPCVAKEQKSIHDDITDSRRVVNFEEAEGERVMGISLCWIL